jgi:hypothetical protein
MLSVCLCPLQKKNIEWMLETSSPKEGAVEEKQSETHPTRDEGWTSPE